MNKQINVFILSAGRRVELINCFKKAAKKLNIKSSIIAGDSSLDAPAIYFADKKFILPKINKDNYIETLIKICKEEMISLIVPTIDTDLIILAKEKERIKKESGAITLISDINVIDICRDKLKTHKFFEEHVFGVPKLYNNSEIYNKKYSFPLFIKPISGSSSINSYKISNEGELNTFLNMIENPMIQEFIEGDEYTVDAFLDFESHIITIVPRKRLATRSGEILKGKIVKDYEIIEDVKRLLIILKPIGHITIQLMKTKDGIKYIEINPRFGGGAPMSIMSGADSCENLYRLFLGQKLKYNENYLDNIKFLRFDDCICVNNYGETIEL